MARRAGAGRVKTRLARDVGAIEALRLYRRLLADTCRKLARDRRWRTLLAITPDHTGARPHLPVRVTISQGRGDLGARMQRLLDRAGPGKTARGPLIIVGADIPGIAPAHIAHAFRLLQGHDAVLGPAADGGYWLVGFSRRRARLAPFASVRWSSPYALADTLANLRGRRVALADTLCDLDTGADLLRHMARQPLFL
jgi:rSAM/selenodomain-associated transferase 1